MDEENSEGTNTPPATAGAEVYFVSRQQEYHFSRPNEVIETQELGEVLPALRRIADAVNKGAHAAGYIAYEAAPAFDPALKTHPSSGLPLIWFGLFPAPEQSIPRFPPGQPFEIGEWEALVPPDEYKANVERIREWIAAGDTYQVNYTFPMRASFSGNPLSWFRTLCAAQLSDYCAYIDMGHYKILSASPELFFRLENDTLTVRPMKGTRPRGLWPEADKRAAEALAASEKEQAENVMIVDLMRSDLGRICEPGSVDTTSLYDVERYETVWQLTSTVTARTHAQIDAILTALFPSGSVTGAPKVRTMEIIREIERFPRGVYCGSIGRIAPGGQAEFNVAIRTVTIDMDKNEAQYPVGGGITWDSTAESEYEECCAKAALLTHPGADFSLLESIFYNGEFYLLDRHLERMQASAQYFGIPFLRERVEADLRARASAWEVSERSPLKIRIILGKTGAIQVEAYSAPAPTGVRLGYSRDPVDVDDVFLYHKTTRRDFYETAHCTRPDCDDVLLWNERNEITESARANVVVELDGELVTPPVESGLLPGTLRAELLSQGVIREAVVSKDDLGQAKNIWLINSIRKWIPVIWREQPE